MRIAYLCADHGIPLDGTKGGSAHVRGLVRALCRSGHQVRVLATSPGAADRLAGAAVLPIATSGVVGFLAHCEDVRVGRALRHVLGNDAAYDRLTTELARWPADVVYERYSPFGFAGGAAAADLGIPHVLEVNASLAEEGARYRGQALQDASRTLEDLAFRSSSLVLPVSRDLRRQVIGRGVDAQRVVVVPNGVDGELFTPAGPRALAELEPRCVVGFVGSLKPWHGIELLVDAFRRVASDPRFHLLVIGDGPRAKLIRSVADELPGRVTWLQAVPHERMPEHLRAIDIAVAPYPALERFYFSPLKVLEYMATGRAIVASRIGDIPELLEDGALGMLVEPGEPEALAAALQRLGNNARWRASLGTRAAYAAHNRHLWMHRAAEIARLVDQVVRDDTRAVGGATA